MWAWLVLVVLNIITLMVINQILYVLKLNCCIPYLLIKYFDKYLLIVNYSMNLIIINIRTQIMILDDLPSWNQSLRIVVVDDLSLRKSTMFLRFPIRNSGKTSGGDDFLWLSNSLSCMSIEKPKNI